MLLEQLHIEQMFTEQKLLEQMFINLKLVEQMYVHLMLLEQMSKCSKTDVAKIEDELLDVFRTKNVIRACVIRTKVKAP